jgi:nucleotide-binding universal stress UspA family protein
MSQIVVGVDESDGAAIALRWAVREGAVRGWSVQAVMAWGFLDQHQGILAERFDPDCGDDALDALAGIVKTAVGTDAADSVRRRAICDLPARALLDAAKGSELLVVGARGLGGFRGLLLGSVSQHCLHHATTPVAIVREEGEPPPERRERVLAAVDGSDSSQRAARWALDEARARQADLYVLNAWSMPNPGGYAYGTFAIDPAVFSDASAQVLGNAIEALDIGDEDVRVERVSVSGGASWAILQATKAADLLVMGSRGLGGFKGMLLGSVTTQVSRHAECPVVVVPPVPS